MIIIDPHAHCRDGFQKDKDTIARVSYFAALAGVGLIFDQPNTDPPITRRDQVIERLELARRTLMPGVNYGLHIGLTSDPSQISEAVECHKEFSLREDGRVGTVGFKYFAGKSVGNLAVVDVGGQRVIFDTLGKLGCKDEVVVSHCEKEEFIWPSVWDPSVPVSHSESRPAKAEFESVTDQVGFYFESNFEGRLHIAHVSTPEVVDYINNIRYNEVKSMKITLGATPQHLFLNYETMKQLGKRGLEWKVNPPIRDKERQEGLLQRLKDGKINWIETDHANHEIEKKLGPPYMSGIPGITCWPRVIDRLREEGVGEKRISELVGKNVLKIYNLPKSVVGDCRVTKDAKFEGYKYGYGGYI